MLLQTRNSVKVKWKVSEMLVDTVRAKTWNCDIEATKEYYMKRFEGAYDPEQYHEEGYKGYYREGYYNH